MTSRTGQQWGALLLPALILWLAAMSACDLRTRQVPNWLTLPPLLGILCWQLAHGHWQALLPLPVFFTLWCLQILGGADAKVLMALFGLWPTLEFAAFFCMGYVLVTLPGLLLRHTWSPKQVWSARRAELTRRPTAEDLETNGTPAIPTYSLVAAAYALLLVLVDWRK